MNYSEEIEKGLEIAREQLGDIDVFIDIYDLTMAWISEKIVESSGKAVEEIVGRPVDEVTFMAIEKYSDFIRKIIIEKNKIYDIPAKTKDGEKKVYKTEHIVVEINGAPRFVAGKVLEVRE